MKKNEMRINIKADLYRYKGETSLKTFSLNLLRNPGFKYMWLFRKCQFHKNKNRFFYFYYRLLLRKFWYKYGYEIPVNVKIGKGFYINHIGGIAINPKAIIGENVNITKGVTIGQINKGKKTGSPVIGDFVWIGANASIVGQIIIGNNVLIAPNSYVNFDVPDNSIVLGNPGKIIRNDNATEGYINNTVK